jgi:hypothetical protein
VAKPRFDVSRRDLVALRWTVSRGVDGLGEAYKLLNHLVSEYKLSSLDQANLAKGKRSSPKWLLHLRAEADA